MPFFADQALPPEEAWALLERELEPFERAARASLESVPRLESGGRVLGADVAATVDVPPADLSAMDGFIVSGALDLGSLAEVRGESAAGRPPDFEMSSNQVARIMTGAVVPAGGDRVLPVEWTEKRGDRVVFHRDAESGANIRRLGEVVRAGEPLLAAGDRVRAGGVALLASHGLERVPVRRRPSVRVLATGDEIVPPEAEPAAGQLRDSNTSYLISAARSLGLEAESLGIAGDDPSELERRIARGLEADVLLLCGGVSKGDYDFVENVLERLGSRTLFDAVRIQPGKPLVAAQHEGGLVFGLPGNPASVMVTFWLFVRPALRRLEGIADGFWQGALRGRLTAPLPGGGGRDRFLPAELRWAGGEIEVLPLAPKGSHDTSVFARGSALVRAHRDSPPASPGDPCEVLPLVGDWP
ncbi:MAG: gephyrin-like molybdotransferase Glp [Acidobacteriota bacterium]